MTTDASYSSVEAAILGRLINPAGPALGREAARYFLSLDFCEEDQRRMRELARKASSGRLSADEQQELEGYNHVGHLLALLHSKARVSLSKAESAD